MDKLCTSEQKALIIAEIAARLVQSACTPANTNIENVLKKFDTAYSHVKRHINYEIK